jgi:outer membrane scaffolding protein for murein synthesis (MipA/OmpV family)
MRTLIRAALLLAAPAILAQATPAAAADYESWLSSANAIRWDSEAAWKVNLGAGLGLAPKFEYARDSELALLPMLDIEWRNFAFASTQRGVGFKLLDTRSTETGVRLTYDFGRSPTDDDFLDGTAEIEATPQLGGYLITYLGAWRVTADFRYATSSYKGISGAIGLAYGGALTDATNVIAGIDAHYASKKYNFAYFEEGKSGVNDVTPFLQIIHSMPRGMYVSLDGRIAIVSGAAKSPDYTASRSYAAGAIVGKRF